MRYVMSQEEIAYWLRRLIAEDDMGWNVDKTELAKAVGAPSFYTLNKILAGDKRWTGSQQTHASKQLRMILNGEWVLEPIPNLQYPRWRKVQASRPVPLAVSRKGMFHVEPGKRVSLTPPPLKVPVSLEPGYFRGKSCQ
jgi:hypothetical protein